MKNFVKKLKNFFTKRRLIIIGIILFVIILLVVLFFAFGGKLLKVDASGFNKTIKVKTIITILLLKPSTFLNFFSPLKLKYK